MLLDCEVGVRRLHTPDWLALRSSLKKSCATVRRHIYYAIRKLLVNRGSTTRIDWKLCGVLHEKLSRLMVPKYNCADLKGEMALQALK